MKTLLLFLSILLCGFANAADYYFSQATGNDSWPGTITQPYKTITKAQTVFTTGNRLYFHRGETWYGTLVAQGSGTSGTQIFVGAYGTGARPIITGFTDVTSWSNISGNIWESTASVST